MLRIHRYSLVQLRDAEVLLLRARISGRSLLRLYVGLAASALLAVGLGCLPLAVASLAWLDSYLTGPLLIIGLFAAPSFGWRAFRLRRGRGHVERIGVRDAQLRLEWAFSPREEVRRMQAGRRLRVLIDRAGTSRWFYGTGDEPWLTFGVTPDSVELRGLGDRRSTVRQDATEQVVRRMGGLLGYAGRPRRVALPNRSIVLTYAPEGTPRLAAEPLRTVQPNVARVVPVASRSGSAASNASLVQREMPIDSIGDASWYYFRVRPRGKGRYKISARYSDPNSLSLAKPSFTVEPGAIRYRYGHIMTTTAEADWVRDLMVTRTHFRVRGRHVVYPAVEFGLVTRGHANPYTLLVAGLEQREYVEVMAVDLYEEADRLRAAVLGVLRNR